MMRRIWQLIDPMGRGSLSTYLRVAFFWNPLASLLFALLFADRGTHLEDFTISMTIATVALTVAFLTVHLYLTLDARLRGAQSLPLRQRGVGRTMVVSGLSLPLGVYAGYALVSFTAGQGWPDLSNMGYGIIIGVTALLAFSLAETLSALREAKHVAELRQRDADNAQLRGQLATLTAQMNPHLLFNTLNTIASLTQTDPDAAEQTTVELASLYRGVLSASRREQHSLKDELEVCRAYLGIETARFGERLTHDLDLDVDLDLGRVLVPPLLIQPLVENAIKHGLSSREDGGHVRVSVRRVGTSLAVEVQDDGVGYRPKTPDSSQHESTGLDNCRRRLSLLHGDEASLSIAALDEGGTLARVELPLRFREDSP